MLFKKYSLKISAIKAMKCEKNDISLNLLLPMLQQKKLHRQSNHVITATKVISKLAGTNLNKPITNKSSKIYKMFRIK